MNRNFFIACLITSLMNLALHVSAYFFFLKVFFSNHTAGSEDLLIQLNRPPDQLNVWAMVVTSMTMGFLITAIIKWMDAITIVSGLKYGFIIAFLFLSSVNFGLYTSSDFYSQEAMFVYFACSAIAMTISGAVAAWMLSRGNIKNPDEKQADM